MNPLTAVAVSLLPVSRLRAAAAFRLLSHTGAPETDLARVERFPDGSVEVSPATPPTAESLTQP